MTNKQIKEFKRVFQLPDEKRYSRAQELVYNRISLAAILKQNDEQITLTRIGGILFVDHATVVYYLKKHIQYINYDDYLDIFKKNNMLYNSTKCFPKKNNMKKDEQILQIKCYSWFHNTYHGLRGLLNYNLNNEENDIAGQTSKLMGLQKGRPDFEFNYEGYTHYAELKTKDGTLSHEQKEYHKLLAEHSFNVMTVRSVEEFQQWIKSIINE